MSPQRLAERRRELLERSATQRDALLAAAAPLVRKAAVPDRMVGYVRRHPLLTAVAAGALLVVGRRKLLSLATTGLSLYALYRRLS